MDKQDRGHGFTVPAQRSLLATVLRTIAIAASGALISVACSATPNGTSNNTVGDLTSDNLTSDNVTSDNGGWFTYTPAGFDPDQYLDKVHGSWVAIMVANHSGLPVEGIWLDEPGPGSEVDLVLLDEWSTDDDTHVEWLDLHIIETYGIDPTYEQIRDEWVDHLNGDIWVATRAARDLMDKGLVPPDTGSPENNPDGAWAMDAQLETELFGMIAPDQPVEARRRAEFFAKVTSSGPAVEASAFYAHLYSRAFALPDIPALLDDARQATQDGSTIAEIYDAVVGWHGQNDDWRDTRRLIGEAYDTDPEWWASRVNFASTIMALLYGEGNLRETLNIAGLAGWDADNNMTTSAGLIGLIIGFENLPEPFASATDVYFNEDLSGDLPQYDSVRNIAKRTAAIGESVLASLDE